MQSFSMNYWDSIPSTYLLWFYFLLLCKKMSWCSAVLSEIDIVSGEYLLVLFENDKSPSSKTFLTPGAPRSTSQPCNFQESNRALYVKVSTKMLCDVID